MERQDIINFLNKFVKYWWIEFNNLTTTYYFDDSLSRQEDIYFLAWVDKSNKWKTNKDKDIIEKNYFVIDLDIRENYKEEITNDDIKWYANILEILLIESELFSERSYIIYTWNWLHIYYIWDFIDVDIDLYSLWVWKIYKDFDDYLQHDNIMKPDQACKNIWRILRLPWTKNYKMKTKYNLEPEEVIILKQQEKHSKLVWMINKFWEEIKENQKQEKSIIKHKVESNLFKNKLNKDWVNVYEEICKIKLNDIICADFWFEQRTDNRYFYWDKKEPEWLVYHDDNNTVFHWWCSKWTWWEVWKTYNTFSYIKARQRLNDKDTFVWFKDRYSHIADIEKKTNIIPDKKEYEYIWYVYPWECFKDFDCMMSWELITIVAPSNSWKTTFAMDILQANSKIWKKWFYINLEFDIRTVWQNRRLYFNWYAKRNLTDLAPLSEQEKNKMNKYIKEQLELFDYFNEPTWLKIEDLINLFVEKSKEWYWLFVIDTFSKIIWNLDQQIARTSQNKSMEMLQKCCQNLWITIINLHHTNKKGEFEWSQKIMDLSNVFIEIEKDDWFWWDNLRNFKLTKDKFITNKELAIYYRNHEYSF